MTIETTLRKRRTKVFLATVVLIVFLFIFFLLGLTQAYIPMSMIDALLALFGEGRDIYVKIVQEVNAPRMLMAIFVGAGLGIAGAAMQAVFKNPMASPYILGLSSGASFGAAAAMLFTIPFIPQAITVPLFAFLACLGTMFLVYFVSRVGGRVPTETLLLSGIAVGSLFSAFVSLLTYIAGDQMEGIVFWSMGNLSYASLEDALVVVPLVLAGSLIMISRGKELNAMMLGDSHAMDLGVHVRNVRLEILIATAVVTAAAVAFVGVIGFVGLVIPHILRIILGPDNRILLPMSMLGGATFLVICDFLSRTLFPSIGTLPIGILTALIGAPYFIYLLRKRKNEVGWN
jgi:ABC-type Fe3+-siderophore transport system, permease component